MALDEARLVVARDDVRDAAIPLENETRVRLQALERPAGSSDVCEQPSQRVPGLAAEHRLDGRRRDRSPRLDEWLRAALGLIGSGARAGAWAGAGAGLWAGAIAGLCAVAPPGSRATRPAGATGGSGARGRRGARAAATLGSHRSANLSRARAGPPGAPRPRAPRAQRSLVLVSPRR